MVNLVWDISPCLSNELMSSYPKIWLAKSTRLRVRGAGAHFLLTWRVAKSNAAVCSKFFSAKNPFGRTQTTLNSRLERPHGYAKCALRLKIVFRSWSADANVTNGRLPA